MRKFNAASVINSFAKMFAPLYVMDGISVDLGCHRFECCGKWCTSIRARITTFDDRVPGDNKCICIGEFEIKDWNYDYSKENAESKKNAKAFVERMIADTYSIITEAVNRQYGNPQDAA